MSGTGKSPTGPEGVPGGDLPARTEDLPGGDLPARTEDLPGADLRADAEDLPGAGLPAAAEGLLPGADLPAPDRSVGHGTPHRAPRGGHVPALTSEQRSRLAQRLSMRRGDGDHGDLLPRTAGAMDLSDPTERLEALVAALAAERVIVPIEVEADPRVTGVHAGLGIGDASGADFARVETPSGPALAVYTSAAALASDRPGARPMPISFRTVALTALVEVGGHVLVDPGAAELLLPRPAVSALAQGDEWLPAWRDPELREELRTLAGCGVERGVKDVRVSYGGGVAVRVDLVADPNTEPLAVRGALARAARAVAGSPRLSVAAERVEVVPLWAPMV
ncbi:SseB family protein [Actinomyces provencensis]|uniref:SseB family protein n=1 Tax=Actinomyces provencensis TaxID=1720198 RepID=UPI001E53C43A|nr:SseB family protein [Actinomyces provencensis]